MKKTIVKMMIGLALISSSALADNAEKTFKQAQYCSLKSLVIGISSLNDKKDLSGADIAWLVNAAIDTFKMKVMAAYAEAYGQTKGAAKYETDKTVAKITLLANQYAEGKLTAEDFSWLVNSEIDLSDMASLKNTGKTNDACANGSERGK